MDKEYMVLEEIKENQYVSQRQLAKTTGLSLGSINILLKKMAKEGLIKIENVPDNRVAYMLTPKGMKEKANKTYKYIRHHYKVIQETKEKIKYLLLELMKENKIIYVLLGQDEVSQLVNISIEELGVNDSIRLISQTYKEPNISGILVIVKHLETSFSDENNIKVVNLADHL